MPGSIGSRLLALHGSFPLSRCKGKRLFLVPCLIFFCSEPRFDFEVVCIYLSSTAEFGDSCPGTSLSKVCSVLSVCLVVHKSAVSLCDYSYIIHPSSYVQQTPSSLSSSLLQLHFLSSTPLYTVRNSLGRFSFLHRQWRRPPPPLSPSPPLHLLVPIPSFILRFFPQLIRLWLSADQGRD